MFCVACKILWNYGDKRESSSTWLSNLQISCHFITFRVSCNVSTVFMLQRVPLSCNKHSLFLTMTKEMTNFSLFFLRMTTVLKLFLLLIVSHFFRLAVTGFHKTKFQHVVTSWWKIARTPHRMFTFIMLLHFRMVCGVESLNPRTKRDFLFQNLYPASLAPNWQL